MLMFSQCLNKETFTVVKERIEYNSFFAHTENLLLCMICDQDENVRRAAYKIIISCRRKTDEISQCDQQQLNVRAFKKPNICIEYLGATDSTRYKHYSNLINWETEEIHEPPYTRKLKVEELIKYMQDNEAVIDVPSIPSHAQGTEFYVQAVKNVVTKYVGQKSQDDRIKGKLVARKLSSTFNFKGFKKSEYQVIDNWCDHI